MDAVCVFIKYNGQWDGTLRYVGGEMKGILVPENSTYVGIIELVRSVIGIRGQDKNIVVRYGVEPRLPLVRLQCDADVKFYIQLKKKDVHVLSKFPVTIDVLDESAVEAIPPEVGESNHIDVQRSREGGHSDEAMQHVNNSNMIIPPPPHIPSPTVGLDLHTNYGIEKQHQLLNNNYCRAHDDCVVEKLNSSADAHRSNDKSIATSIGGHSIVNNTRSQYDKVSSSDSVSDGVIVADFTPVTLRINNIFQHKKLLQYHLHHDAMNNEACPWQLRATRMRGSELFVVKRYDDVHTCSIEIVQGHHRQASSWMIGECVKAKYLDPTNTSYRPREIMRDMQAEFGVSFTYLKPWRGKEAALTSLRGNDTESYNDILLYLIISNLKIKYKDFKGPLKTYFDGRSYKVIASIFQKAERLEEALKLTSKLAPRAENLLRTNFSIGLRVTPRPADQFEYAVTNNASQIWIVDMSERTCTCMRFQVDQIPCPHAMAFILLAAQMAGMFLKKSGRKLSILPIQSVDPEGHEFKGFCHKEKNMSLFGVVDVMVMDTTDKPVPIQSF
ncbi:hypothetical protein TIFTF001_041374 [Ficus carica]|uniref:SWIM-type domain-containing protein n=1 Tax=Ficus carica TaxID=3494 RepID=A0AA87ZDW2_FICCA|nr:hypothetical protein TIFTF001_041374 [Ficus carica]